MQNTIVSMPLRVRSAGTLTFREVSWLWQHWLADGKLAILDGDPGLGKSLITLDLCARLSTGRAMPDGSHGPGTPVNCLILNAEDGAEDTINHRLQALGADRDRVFVVERAEIDWAEPIRLPSQIGALEEVIASHQARLVVIDPVMAFLEPRIQISNDQSVRQALYPLQRLAALHHCAVLLVRHLNKTNDGRARYRGGGSIGFQGACRCTWLVERDPDRPDGCVLAQVKNNLAPRQRSLAYRLSAPGTAPASSPSSLPTLPPAPLTVAWEGFSPWSADQLLATPARGPVIQQLDRAIGFLEDVLRDGPRTPAEIWEAARPRGFSKGTLQRAREKLNISVSRVGKGKNHRSYWRLEGQPLPDSIPPEDVVPSLEPWLKPLIEAYPVPTPLDD
jgi:hypothetical protein